MLCVHMSCMRTATWLKILRDLGSEVERVEKQGGASDIEAPPLGSRSERHFRLFYLLAYPLPLSTLFSGSCETYFYPLES